MSDEHVKMVEEFESLFNKWFPQFSSFSPEERFILVDVTLGTFRSFITEIIDKEDKSDGNGPE